MAGRGIGGRKFLGALTLVFVLGCAGVAWMERATLLSWFYIRGLTRAAESDRAGWVERVANLGETALPGLLDCLTQSDAQVCGNARAAVERMSQSWCSDYDRYADLALLLAREFAQFSPAGQRQVLDLAAGWLNNPQGNTNGLVAPCARLVSEAAGTTDADVQAAALDLCGVLLTQPNGDEALRPGQDLVRNALHSPGVDNRLRRRPPVPASGHGHAGAGRLALGR